MDFNPQPGQRQDLAAAERARYLFYSVVALLVFLFSFAAWSVSHPAPPAADWHPAPDPPRVDNSVHVEVLSNNKFFSDNQTCIGACR